MFKIYYSVDASKPGALKVVAIVKASSEDNPTWSQSIKADRKKKSGAFPRKRCLAMETHLFVRVEWNNCLTCY